MDGKESGCATAVLCFIAMFLLFGGGREHISHTVTGDVLTCLNPKKADPMSSQCFRTQATTKVTITVTPNSNSCAIKEEGGDLKAPMLSPGAQLIYIDEDNWQCDATAYTNFLKVASLSDGDLRMTLTDKDHTLNTDFYPIERSDTISGKFRHYMRAVRDSK